MIELKPMDIVCAHGCSWMTGAISTVETHWRNCDHDYCHSFIAEKSDGTIIDTLLHVERGNIYRDYTGQELLIGRFKNPDPAKVQAALTEVAKDIGKLYPAWRLPFFAAGEGVELTGDEKVCSERSAWAGSLAFDFDPWKEWQGQAPGHIAFVMQYAKDFDIVFQGKID